MKRFLPVILVAVFSVAAFAQTPNRPTLVAGLPVNYDEDKTGDYRLPELLVTADGKTVTDAKTWTKKRRPEILKLIAEQQFGKTPAAPKNMRFDVFDQGTLSFNGKAIRKQVTIYFDKNSAEHKMNLLIYLPAKVKTKVPLLLKNRIENSGRKCRRIL